MDIWLGLIIVVSVCVWVVAVRHVYLESGNKGRAFLNGFAYPSFFVSIAVIYYCVPENMLPKGMDSELFSVLMAGIVLAILVHGHSLFWIVRNTWKKTRRLIRKAFRERTIRCGLWQFSFLRKKGKQSQ